MTTEPGKINQKEYLKRYLSTKKDEKKKKKKKKLNVGPKKVNIIDDDIDLKKLGTIDDDEISIFNATEDAPQIVGIIDERGPVDFENKQRWKVIADDGTGDITISKVEQPKNIVRDNQNNNDVSKTKKQTVKETKKVAKHKKKRKNSSSSDDESDSDSESEREQKSKKRKRRKSPKRKKKSKKKSNSSDSSSDSDSESDLSLPRSGRKINKNVSKNKRQSDSDLSPPRPHSKENNEIKKRTTWDRRERSASPSRNRTKNRTASDSDLSPCRKNKKDIDSHRRARKRSADSDLSPPRARKDKYESKKKKHNSDSDLSPPRSSKNNQDKKFNKYNDFDLESQASKYDSDTSPRRNGKHKRDSNSYNSHRSPQRNSYSKHDKYHKKTDNSPNQSRHRTSRWDDSRKSPSPEKSQENKKMKKTLDGTSAGLQNLKSLKEEEEAQKKKEAEMMKKMSRELSGYGQTTVIRDRKTGRKRDLDKEAAEKWEKQKVQDEIDAKYAQWGKGLKQLEDRDDKLKSDLHEMNKPLARYADDEDLDRELRAKEREDDPMLAYIREKEIKEGKRAPEKPKYQGTFMPNRFGIKPGYRWDGVDRSNGYEKKWFEAKNARKAVEDEAYKWSTADM